MKDAMHDPQHYDAFRASQLQRVIDAANRYGVELRDRDVLDFGCGEGALTGALYQQRPRRLVGIDIDPSFIERAKMTHADAPLEFLLSEVHRIPLADNSMDVVVAFDVFEHVSRPLPILSECRRILKPGGKILIGTCGWHNPFAPHLWATMPVPWAHVLFSERTVLRTCRRVYRSDWYQPNQFDFDKAGRKIADKYSNVSISSDYVNKYLLSDFEEVFEEAGFDYQMHLVPFSSKWARWTKPLLKMPVLREYLHSYFWAVLVKPQSVPDQNSDVDITQSMPADLMKTASPSESRATIAVM